MAARKNNARREERIAKNNRRLNSALSLFTAGFVAECYLLLLNQYFVKGTISQVVAASYFLDVMVWVGLALVAAGVVLTVMREKRAGFAAWGKWLVVLGVFFTLSSQLMRKIYPAGTTAMCILVPVLMLLSIVLLLYQHEFAVQAVSLTITLAAAALLNRGASNSAWLLKALVVLAIAAILVLCVLVGAAQKNGGALRGVTLFPAKTDYRLTYGVLAFCEAAIVLSLVVAGGAYWAIWAAAIVLFALAVWYTVKLL